MSTALFFLLVLGSSLAANLLIFVPVAAWWRGVLNRRSETISAGAFQLLFGHVRVLRGRAVVFHQNGEVTTHDARAFLRSVALATAARSPAIPVINKPVEDEPPPPSDLSRSLEQLRAAERGDLGDLSDEGPATPRGAS